LPRDGSWNGSRRSMFIVIKLVYARDCSLPAKNPSNNLYSAMNSDVFINSSYFFHLRSYPYLDLIDSSIYYWTVAKVLSLCLLIPNRWLIAILANPL